MQQDALLINCDGGARGNPGPAAIGALLWTPDRKVITFLSERIGSTTSNVAEYAALAKALQLAVRYTKGEVRVMMDSELVVRQLTGVYRVRAQHLLPLYESVKRLETSFAKVTYTAVRRTDKYQARADKLVNEALDRKE